MCIVRYSKITRGSSTPAPNAALATEIFRSEVVANDSNPDFSSWFRFQPQDEKFKENKNDAEPVPATLMFEFYDTRMRDAYRDSKNLVPKPNDLLGRAEFSLDEIFERFVDLVADNAFKEQMDTDSSIKGARHYREDFMKAIRENREGDKLNAYLKNPNNAPAIKNMTWTVDKELSVPQTSALSLGQNSAVFIGKCCGANYGQDLKPSITLNFVCVLSDKSDKETGAKSADSAMAEINKCTSVEHDYGIDDEDEQAQDNMGANYLLEYSNLIPYRASDTPSIKQQVQRYRGNLARTSEDEESVASMIESALAEFKSHDFTNQESIKNESMKFMIRLRSTAFKNPRLFFKRGPVGEPYTMYGFLLTLHTFRDDVPPESKHLILDFWHILSFLKLGLLRSVFEVQEKESPESQKALSMVAELTRRYNTVELRDQLKQKFKGQETTPDSSQTSADTKFILAWIDSLIFAGDFEKAGQKQKFSDIIQEDASKFQQHKKRSVNDDFLEEHVLKFLNGIIKDKAAHNRTVDLICAIECEFQWLLCQEYSPNIYSLEDMLSSGDKNQRETCTVINEYSGENLLHLLIIRGSLEHIVTLSDNITSLDYRQVMLNARVTGRFFCPVYGEVYYGQTPLHFAISTGQINVVKYLLEHWCSDDITRYFCLWQKDSRDNSVLHLCVLKSLTSMYDFLLFSMTELEKSLKSLEWWHHEPRLTVSDDDCLKNYKYNTPIELAAIIGDARMLSHLINKEKQKNFGWSYGSATLSATRVRDIDSYKTLTCPREPEYLANYALPHSEGRLKFIYRSVIAKIRSRNEVEPSVLSILIEKEQKKLLNIPIIQGLVQFKWMTFGQQLLICWAFVALAIFILFEIVCYNIIYPSDQAGLALESNHSFSAIEITLYTVAALFLLCRQYFQLDLGIAMQQPESVYATFNPDAPAVPRSELVYPSYPSWKLGFKLKDALDKRRGSENGMILESFAEKMLSNPFRTEQVQPYFVTQGLDIASPHASRTEADLRPYSIFTKLLWRVTFQDLMKEGGFWGVAWAILVLLSAFIRLALPSDRKLVAEQVALALASVCIFFYMTGFYSFSNRLGPFMVLLQHMFMDLTKWLSITVLFFLGYAQAMLIVTSDTNVSAFGTYKWLLGDSSTDQISGSDVLQGVIIFLFISYSILVSISLVNILTAMFGSTYGEIMENSKETWFLEYSFPFQYTHFYLRLRLC
jgi:hypothetical protein